MSKNSQEIVSFFFYLYTMKKNYKPHFIICYFFKAQFTVKVESPKDFNLMKLIL